MSCTHTYTHIRYHPMPFNPSSGQIHLFNTKLVINWQSSECRCENMKWKQSGGGDLGRRVGGIVDELLASEPAGYGVDNLVFVHLGAVVNHQDLLILLGLPPHQPILVLLVYLAQVVQRNRALALSAPLLDPLRAGFGRTADVYYPVEVYYVVHADQVVVEVQVDGVLCLVEELGVAHDAGEDVAVGEEGALGDAYALADYLAVLSPLVDSGHEGVDLKGEAPPLGVLIVHAQQVDVLILPHLLPLAQGLVEDGELREVFPDDGEQGGFTTADVALDGDEPRLAVMWFWRHPVKLKCIHITQSTHYIILHTTSGYCRLATRSSTMDSGLDNGRWHYQFWLCWIDYHLSTAHKYVINCTQITPAAAPSTRLSRARPWLCG